MQSSHALHVAALAQPVVDVECTTIVSPSRTGAERRRSTTTFDQFDDAVVDFPLSPSMTPSSMLLDVHSVAAPHDTASWSPHFDGGVTREFTVSPLHATLVMHFEDDARLALAELARRPRSA